MLLGSRNRDEGVDLETYIYASALVLIISQANLNRADAEARCFLTIPGRAEATLVEPRGVQDNSDRQKLSENHPRNHQKHTWPGRGGATAAGEAEPTVVAGEA